MKPFDPQLSQQDLAAWIDAEGLQFQALMECANGANPYTHDTTFGNAQKHIDHGIRIRVAPGALTEFGLKPGMVPQNPDDLPADQITEGGKWRAAVIGDKSFDDGQYWCKAVGEWWGISNLNVLGTEDYTVRLPVNHPFPKPSRTEPTYPCEDCGVLRTKAEGGTIFTVCDECWDKRLKPETPEQSSVILQAGQSLTPRTDMLLSDPDVRSTNLVCTFARQLERELTAALAQRDEANRLLGEAAEALIWAMGMEPSPCRCLDCATPPHVCKGHKTLDAITNHLKP